MGNLATAEACPANPGRPQTISAFNKTFLQRRSIWYWTGEIEGAENQWAEFTFKMDEEDPRRATMVVNETYWEKTSMQVDEDKEMSDLASSSLSIADGM